MSLVEHAQRELKVLGNDEEFNKGVIKIIQAFADMGHSGSSAAYTIHLINDLLWFRNIKPLTDDPNEWNIIDSRMGFKKGTWQNNRNPEAFSNDGGRTYYLLSEGGNDQHREPLHETKRVGS